MKAVKAVKRVFALLFAMMIGAGAAIAVLQFVTPYKPFRKEETELTVTPGETTDALSLASERTGENVQTITATVKAPDGTAKPELQSVVWSITENEAVTLTANGMTATLTCNAAFGEPITVTCTSAIDTGVSATVTLEYEKKAERVLMWGHVLTAAPLTDTVYDVACGGGTDPFDLIGGVQYSDVFTRSASRYRVKVELAPTEELISKIHAVNTGITCNSYVKTDITVFPYRDVWYDLLGVFSDGFQYQSQIETTVNECAKDYLVTVTVQGNYTEQVFQCYINVNFT